MINKLADIHENERSTLRNRRLRWNVGCLLAFLLILITPIALPFLIAAHSQYRLNRFCAASKSVIVFVTSFRLHDGGYYELTGADATHFLKIMSAGTAPGEFAGRLNARPELSMTLLGEDHQTLASVILELDGTTDGMTVWSLLRTIALSGRRLTDIEQQQYGGIPDESTPSLMRKWYQ